MSHNDLELDSDEMVNCPYDTKHRMLRKRLQQHILKCRLNYPDVELKKCPFNQLHLVAEKEYDLHIRYCGDQKSVTEYKQMSSTLNESVSHPPIDCEGESWDDENSEDEAKSSTQNSEHIKFIKKERD